MASYNNNIPRACKSDYNIYWGYNYYNINTLSAPCILCALCQYIEYLIALKRIISKR